MSGYEIDCPCRRTGVGLKMPKGVRLQMPFIVRLDMRMSVRIQENTHPQTNSA